MWCAPALAAHVMDAHVAQRQLAVLGVHLGCGAQQHLEHVHLLVRDRVVDRAAPLVLVHAEGICVLLQEVRYAIAPPAWGNSHLSIEPQVNRLSHCSRALAALLVLSCHRLHPTLSALLSRFLRDPHGSACCNFDHPINEGCKACVTDTTKLGRSIFSSPEASSTHAMPHACRHTGNAVRPIICRLTLSRRPASEGSCPATCARS